jgi:hypothetical protein
MVAHTNRAGITGHLVIERFDEDGALLERCETTNLVTQVGDQMYGERAVGLGTLAAPTGMRLGTGANTGGNVPAKTGTGAALTTYLSGSNKAFDATYPQSSLSGANARRITYRRTYAAGEATTASAITEIVIVNDTIATDATSTAANTISRAAVAGISAKAATDSLVATWNHDLLGA